MREHCHIVLEHQESHCAKLHVAQSCDYLGNSLHTLENMLSSHRHKELRRLRLRVGELPHIYAPMAQLGHEKMSPRLTCGNIAVAISHRLIIHHHHNTAIWGALLITATSKARPWMSVADLHNAEGPSFDGTHTFVTSLRASSFGGSGLVAGVNIFHVSSTDCPWHEPGRASAEDPGAHPLRPKDDERHEGVCATGSASRPGGRGTRTHRLDDLRCDQQALRGRLRAVYRDQSVRACALSPAGRAAVVCALT